MKSIVLCGQSAKQKYSSVKTFSLHDVPIHSGILESKSPSHKNSSFENSNHVLVKKLAFSCNYRDKGLILLKAQSFSRNASIDSYSCFGSEFVAEVVEVSSKVKSLKPGDRVIPNGAYPFSLAPHAGLPTNDASAGIQIINEHHLLKIPRSMPIEVAAGFTIGSQTVFGMLNRLKIGRDSNVLVTSPNSNTSLFALAALKSIKCKVYALTTSLKNEEKLMKMGLKGIFKANFDSPSIIGNGEDIDKIKNINGFDFIIDPFSDLYLVRCIDLLNYGGKYITCGIHKQHNLIEGQKKYDFSSSESLAKIIVKNLTIIGNCLGSSDDLQSAVDSYGNGEFKVLVDSIYEGDNSKEFLERTFVDEDRFGKVVYRYPGE